MCWLVCSCSARSSSLFGRELYPRLGFYHNKNINSVIFQESNNVYDFLSGVKVTSETKFLALDNPAEMTQLLDTVHFMHYAVAAYGWPMYIFQNKTMPVCKSVFNLSTSMTCCCLPLCASKIDESVVVVEDNCCGCNMAALKQVQSIPHSSNIMQQ